MNAEAYKTEVAFVKEHPALEATRPTNVPGALLWADEVAEALAEARRLGIGLHYREPAMLARTVDAAEKVTASHAASGSALGLVDWLGEGLDLDDPADVQAFAALSVFAACLDYLEDRPSRPADDPPVAPGVPKGTSGRRVPAEGPPEPLAEPERMHTAEGDGDGSEAQPEAADDGPKGRRKGEPAKQTNGGRQEPDRTDKTKRHRCELCGDDDCGDGIGHGQVIDLEERRRLGFFGTTTLPPMRVLGTQPWGDGAA